MIESELVALKRKDLQVLAEEHGLNAKKKSRNQLVAELFVVLAPEATASEATAEVSAEHSLLCNENSQKVSCRAGDKIPFVTKINNCMLHKCLHIVICFCHPFL